MKTTGNTAETVTLYVYAPNENILLSRTETSEHLHVKARRAYEAKDVKIEYDNRTDAQHPFLIVQKGDKTIKMPINQNIAYVNEDPVKLNGIVLYNGMNAFIPQKAVDLLAEQAG